MTSGASSGRPERRLQQAWVVEAQGTLQLVAGLFGTDAGTTGMSIRVGSGQRPSVGRRGGPNQGGRVAEATEQNPGSATCLNLARSVSICCVSPLDFLDFSFL